MTMIVDVPGLQAELDKLYRSKQFDELLISLERMYLMLLQMPELKGRALFEPISDAYLRIFAEQHFGQTRRQARPKAILHVATEVYEVGGHSRILEDIVKALPDYQHTLVLTDILDNYATGRLKLGFLEERFEELGLRVIRLRSPGRLDRLQELDRVIERVAPNTIFINAHHFDTVTYGTICGASAPRVVFLHHCDYEPSLGATRGDFEHLDVANKCYDQCKLHGFTQPSLLSMTVKDAGPLELDWSLPFSGLTSGTHIKFAGKAGFTYAELLVRLFRCGVHTMHHVGDLTSNQLTEIAGSLAAADIDSQRFRFHGRVPSLSATMKEVKPHFYMTSHPNGGYKAVIEATAIGLPIIQSKVFDDTLIFGMPESVAEIASFETLDELPACLTRVRETGSDWGRRNRTKYEITYAPEVFRSTLLSYVSERAAPVTAMIA